eukprot:CAMPEP_0178383752 /NCGR_PEP_ID=MMETSP0689_2-20121128/7160_1 /TAXON_ID=160604 /ORGANISM="Amphidinium massartii, Strain CS-259" /LENGTH=340 /DNA_ID=CAMNT_0020003975 /DNA_START=89 /DNA_END=1111 /DNA_ORIENTATION=+
MTSSKLLGALKDLRAGELPDVAELGVRKLRRGSRDSSEGIQRGGVANVVSALQGAGSDGVAIALAALLAQDATDKGDSVTPVRLAKQLRTVAALMEVRPRRHGGGRRGYSAASSSSSAGAVPRAAPSASASRSPPRGSRSHSRSRTPRKRIVLRPARNEHSAASSSNGSGLVSSAAVRAARAVTAFRRQAQADREKCRSEQRAQRGGSARRRREAERERRQRCRSRSSGVSGGSIQSAPVSDEKPRSPSPSPVKQKVIEPGCYVRLCGLTSAQELNGALAVCEGAGGGGAEGASSSSQRWVVRLVSTGARKSIKASNVELADDVEEHEEEDEIREVSEDA